MEEMSMRGRTPAGPESIEHLQGSHKAKERLRVILETMMGEHRVAEACRLLGICEQRFRQLRAELLQAALERLEGLPAGRPRRPAEPQEIAALRQQLAETQLELHTAQVREEIALAMPQVLAPKEAEAPADDNSVAQKKTPQRPRP
jgi:transposase-like protein